CGDRAVAGRLGAVLGLCPELRQLQQDLRLGRRHRDPDDVVLPDGLRGAAWRRAERRDRASDRPRYHRRPARADGQAWRPCRRYGRPTTTVMPMVLTGSDTERWLTGQKPAGAVYAAGDHVVI